MKYRKYLVLLLLPLLLYGGVKIYQNRRIEIVSKTDDSGIYQIKVMQIGSPEFPFGPVNFEVRLLKSGKKINSSVMSLKNDGKNLMEENFEITFRVNDCSIMVNCEEEEPFEINWKYE